ncbi:hypothetical protein CC85DRAFT_308742 [Cutaneotrichosporon oleaginosum]|uniref:Rab-GAP TBC domain-containing protein n=1 Tax=Cutaneotrichosporon oleaginosum TaxID=879819 RepID=A0A0J0XIQ9_9TREE|nr:uncharacterized protein CC85DRAFT_308742 [Cutaneotrichosporon oleaginosum]KLT40971.1 hypothetical protein CC85DRAFT_308742 [Cutaneotrichosporon oleaginosum]TXT06240.1 hypothetical protein COLE_05571 [Cutaneotrichosporon oleaginosum]
MSGTSGVHEKARGWEAARDALVDAAVAAHDEDTLRRLSAMPGGFGSRPARCRAWLELLHVDRLRSASVSPDTTRFATPDTDAETVVYTPHRDEEQVLLDTRRAFVTYPRDVSSDAKAEMQEDLQALICAVLQRHPALHYFQGFHDIATVLYLTLLSRVPRPREGATATDREEWDTLVRATEVVALSRVRDGMGKDLGAMMGMLKLLRRVLAAADPGLYRISASISPVPTLPFFALSWILTLFSHDVDTLAPVQRIFDYLIARNPISAIYLAVAILMSKKRQMLKLAAALGPEARLDPSLLHPLFQRLPPLYADTPEEPRPPPDFHPPEHGAKYDEPNPYAPIALSGIFQLADKLQAKHPFDGSRIRAHEVLGPGSVVRTYARELGDSLNHNSELDDGEMDEKAALKGWTLADAEACIDKDVVLPGGSELDDDDETVPWPDRLGELARSQRVVTALTLGVLFLGVGAALYRSSGRYRLAGLWASYVRRDMSWARAYFGHYVRYVPALRDL